MAEAGDGPGSPADWADGRDDRQGDGASGEAEDDGENPGGDNAHATDVTEPVSPRLVGHIIVDHISRPPSLVE
jgi:hypothetical protein